MTKLVLLTILTFIGLALVVYSPSSKEYWEGVGPQWDEMLNPCKYKECDQEVSQIM